MSLHEFLRSWKRATDAASLPRPSRGQAPAGGQRFISADEMTDTDWLVVQQQSAAPTTNPSPTLFSHKPNPASFPTPQGEGKADRTVGPDTDAGADGAGQITERGHAW